MVIACAQASISDCSNFHIMCDVPSTAVFYSKSVECFSCMSSKFFLKPFVTMLVAPILTGIIIPFIFHICLISVHKLLYCSFFSASFYVTFLSTAISTSTSMHVFSFSFLIIICGLFAVTSVSVHPLIPQHCHIFKFTYWCVRACVHTISLSF